MDDQDDIIPKLGPKLDKLQSTIEKIKDGGQKTKWNETIGPTEKNHTSGPTGKKDVNIIPKISSQFKLSFMLQFFFVQLAFNFCSREDQGTRLRWWNGTMNSAQLIAYLLLRLIQKYNQEVFIEHILQRTTIHVYVYVFDILVATFVLAEQISSRVGRPPHQNQPVGAQVKLFSSTKKTWPSVRGETRPNSTGENLSELKIDDHVLWHKIYVRDALL